MMTAILDTNVLVQSVISSPRSASVRVRESLYDGSFQLVLSPGAIDELIDVLMLPRIRIRHGFSDSEILEFIESLLLNAAMFPGELHVPADITRDMTDTKFLALAEESDADYLVTNDRRHLLPLKRYGRTQIVTPARFLRELARALRTI